MESTSTRPSGRADPGSSPMPPGSTRRRTWLWRLLLVLGAVGTALAVGEVAVRILDVGPQLGAVDAGAFRLSENRVLRYEFLPGARDGAAKINSDGMRDRPRNVAAPAGTFRIACIGDSICGGFKGPIAEAFPARLEHLLNRYWATPETAFEVLNFGVTGYNITQVAQNLRVRGLKYAPDVVVYAYCHNDLLDYSFELQQLRARITAAQRSFFQRTLGTPGRLVGHARLYALWRYAAESHTFEGKRRARLEPDPLHDHVELGTYQRFFRTHYQSREGWNRITTGLDELAASCRAREASIYVVVFPGFGDLEAYPLEPFHRQVLAAAQQRGLNGLDLLGAYQALSSTTEEPVAIDFLHPSATGYGLAAVAILQALLAGEEVLAGGPGIDVVAAGDQPEALAARLLLALEAASGPPADEQPNARQAP